MLLRTQAVVIKKLSSIYPAIGLNGPRQAGKTTLARTLFNNLPYVSLENPNCRAEALDDPRGFLKKYEKGAILDEIQHTPELVSYLQQILDESPEKGRFVLTGSQNFVISQSITQSLAGRIGMLTLLPLSLDEINYSNIDENTAIFKGAYPALHSLNINPLDFYPSYIQTYLEKDVRQIKNIINIRVFQKFLKLCAARTGQLINFSSLAQDCGVSHTTAKQWITLLEASYIIFLLPPFYKNYNKRVTKMPKLYFYDTGLACSLLGIDDVSQIDNHHLKGALFENLVILELLKGRLNLGRIPNLYFWRDHSAHEIDCIAEWGASIKAIEIKANHTYHQNHLKGLKYFHTMVEESQSYLVYCGDNSAKINNTQLIPFNQLSQSFFNNE